MADSEIFPWLKHLPEDERYDFWNEILAISVQSNELSTPMPDYVRRLEANIAAWKATAEVHADPELMKALTEKDVPGVTDLELPHFNPAAKVEIEMERRMQARRAADFVADEAEGLPHGDPKLEVETERRHRRIQGFTPQYEIRDEIQNFPGLPHGE